MDLYYVRNTDPEFRSLLFNEVDFCRFVLTHRSDNTTISNGISFIRFQTMYIEKVLRLVHVEEYRFWKHLTKLKGSDGETSANQICFEELTKIAETVFIDRLTNLVKLCPSDDTSAHLFLTYFQMNKDLYEREMRTVGATALMAVDAFKVNSYFFCFPVTHIFDTHFPQSFPTALINLLDCHGLYKTNRFYFLLSVQLQMNRRRHVVRKIRQ